MVDATLTPISRTQLQLSTPGTLTSALRQRQTRKEQSQAAALKQDIDRAGLAKTKQATSIAGAQEQRAITGEAREAATFSREEQAAELAELTAIETILSRVTDEASFQVAETQIENRFPGEFSDEIERLFPGGFDAATVKTLQTNLGTAKKLISTAAGAQLRDPITGEAVGEQTPFKPAADKPKKFKVFELENGDQVFIEEGVGPPAGAKLVKAGGVTVNVGGKAAPSGERQNLVELLGFQNQLGRISDLFDKGFVGPLQGPIGKLKQITGLGAKEKEVIFRQVVKSIGDEILRLRSGAAINENEAKRLKEFIPQLESPDAVFLGQLKSLETEFDKIITLRQTALTESGFRAPGTTQPSGGGIVIRFDAQGNQIQ